MIAISGQSFCKLGLVVQSSADGKNLEEFKKDQYPIHVVWMNFEKPHNVDGGKKPSLHRYNSSWKMEPDVEQNFPKSYRIIKAIQAGHR